MGALLNLAMGSVADVEQDAGDRLSADQWREFESLLAIVGAAYRTPASQYQEIRAVAARDIGAAIESYRIMAKQIAGREP